MRQFSLSLIICLTLIHVGAAHAQVASGRASGPTIRPEWQEPFQAVFDRLDKNTIPPNRKNPYYHVHPAPLYPGVYMWDSSFIALIWKVKDPAIAQDVIRSIVYGQQADGRIPQVVGPLGPNNNGLSNPAVVSYAAAEIAAKTHDVAFVKSVYPSLKLYHSWLWANRRFNNGLFFWLKPYESGIDNSPKYSNRDESQVKNTAQVAASDASAYAVLDSENLAKLARMILPTAAAGSHEALMLREDIARFDNDAATTAELMRKYLWNEEDGYFYDRDVITKQFVRIATVSSLIPLLAGVPNQNQWLRLREHIVNPKEFGTLIPIPSVSHAEPAFEKDTWRGPVWINTAYMVIQGIKRYGDQGLKRELATRLVNGVYGTRAAAGDFYEYYDPDQYSLKDLTRKKGLGRFGLSASKDPLKVLSWLLMKRIILGTKPVKHFIGWTGLVNTLVVDDLQDQSVSATAAFAAPLVVPERIVAAPVAVVDSAPLFVAHAQRALVAPPVQISAQAPMKVPTSSVPRAPVVVAVVSKPVSRSVALPVFKFAPIVQTKPALETKPVVELAPVAAFRSAPRTLAQIMSAAVAQPKLAKPVARAPEKAAETKIAVASALSAPVPVTVVSTPVIENNPVVERAPVAVVRSAPKTLASLLFSPIAQPVQIVAPKTVALSMQAPVALGSTTKTIAPSAQSLAPKVLAPVSIVGSAPKTLAPLISAPVAQPVKIVAPSHVSARKHKSAGRKRNVEELNGPKSVIAM